MIIDKQNIVDWFKALQDEICQGLESLDSSSKFVEDLWERAGGGGGRTRIFKGHHIEKGGVNFSEVFGDLSPEIQAKLGIPEAHFFATGVSIVLHPSNPWVPIIHMNIRYFESGEKWWFGGGIDLTPHYINLDEASFFHKELNKVCDHLSPEAYAEFKTWADNYFYIKHRNETRGIGGIFFDHLDHKRGSKNELAEFVLNVGKTFLPIYSKLFNQNFQRQFSKKEKTWQAYRRGRYVEFNLVWDRGTKFGLETNGRTESILMSLPPLAQWDYDVQPVKGSLEEETIMQLRKGIDWKS